MLLLGRAPSAPPRPNSQLLQFRDALRDLGYVEGRSIEIDVRAGAGVELAARAADLIRLKVDVIVAISTPAAIVAKRSTTRIPVVFAAAGDPVERGLVDSLAQPGGNVTGIYELTTELSGKRLGLLREALPRAARIGILWDPSSDPGASELREAQAAAERLRLSLVRLDVRTADEIGTIGLSAKKARVDGVSVLTSPVLALNLRQVASVLLEARLPSIAGYSPFTDLGGLLAYGVSARETFRRAAAYVDKILKGARPADLPSEQVREFAFTINLKTAKALAVTIPPSLIVQATQVIE